MGQLFRALSLSPRSVRYKLSIIFALISFIPMLVCGFFVSFYILPNFDTTGEIYLILAITLFLILLGCYLARRIIYPIVKITAHARGIVEGDLDKELNIKEDDEIGQLSSSLNRLSIRLKENMNLLHSYGEKMKQINLEINKKVFALSSLLQIGNLITASSNINDIFNLILTKLSQLEEDGVAFLMLLDEQSGELIMREKINIEAASLGEIKIKIGQGLLGKLFENGQPLIIDQQKRFKNIDKNSSKILQTKNIAILPVLVFGKIAGILGTGNNKDNFIYLDNEIELIEVFVKQVSVAIENHILTNKTKELVVRDELTGLYNENYICSRLEEEIKRAVSYQRPCSFIVFEFANLKQCQNILGEKIFANILKKVAQIFRENISDIDKAARLSENQFAILLPEKNKMQSLSFAQNISQQIKRYIVSEKKLKDTLQLKLNIGISATPIDGTTATEVIKKAFQYVNKAKEEKQNDIVFS
jgi:diguanylate cyclase (GGDEF)-like protein